MIILSGNLNTEGRFVSFTSMNLMGDELGHSTNTVINISFIFFFASGKLQGTPAYVLMLLLSIKNHATVTCWMLNVLLYVLPITIFPYSSFFFFFFFFRSLKWGRQKTMLLEHKVELKKWDKSFLFFVIMVHASFK